MSAAPEPEYSSLDDLFASYTLAVKRLANALKAAPALPPELLDQRTNEELLAVIQNPGYFDFLTRAAAASEYLRRVEPCVGGMDRITVRGALEGIRSTDPARVVQAVSWVESTVCETREDLQKGPRRNRP